MVLQLALESNPLVVRESREHTWGNMHRQLSFVTGMAPTTKASVLIVCCRTHNESVAAYTHTLTVMQRLHYRGVRSIYMSMILVRSHYCSQHCSFLDKQTEGMVAHLYRNTHTPGIYQCSTAANWLTIVIISSIVCWVACKALSFFWVIATVFLLLCNCSWRVLQYLLSCQLVIDLTQLTGTVTGGQ